MQNENRSGDVKVYGVDGVPEIKEMIFSLRMTAAAGQSPRQIGKLAANLDSRD